jgi:pimeloyl-ACP methyl ester carboxylesterase
MARFVADAVFLARGVLAQSGFIPAREADEMLRRRPGTMAMSVPGAGHDLHLERPGVLYAAVSGFLGGLA